MTDIHTQNARTIIYAIVIFGLIFMVASIYRSSQQNNRPPVDYLHNTQPTVIPPIHTREKFDTLPFPEIPINTESMTIGGHSSAHTSAIIASPYNPPNPLHNLINLNKNIPDNYKPYQKPFYPPNIKLPKQQYYH